MSTDQSASAGQGDAQAQRPAFGFGPDEAALKEVARRFLADRFSAQTLRNLVATDHEAVYERGQAVAWDRDLWAEVVEMGWPALAVPEQAGGVPVSFPGLVGLVEEVGFRALVSPLVSTLATATVLGHCDIDRAGPTLAEIAGGIPAALATTGPTGRWDGSDCDVEAVSDGTGYRLSGRAAFVQDGGKAQRLVVLARHGANHLLIVVRPDADGVRVEPDHIHDLTRDQATVHLDSAPVTGADVVAPSAADVLVAANPARLTLAAADLCGAGEWLLQTTVDYAKQRTQFERPIGFFQAVKHPLVDVMIDLDQARSLTYHAADLIDQGDHGAERAGRMAKSMASDAASFAADRAVQLHGGIGFTWEHDVHLYFKRVMHGQAILGDGAHHRRVLANLLLGKI